MALATRLPLHQNSDFEEPCNRQLKTTNADVAKRAARA